ncbi:MAG: polysaccharide deacetylase family protein [Candidatus Omnitrophica bacterium]|nr:polysaccharide deacetylase family protein [Candidatus Omnitrophota bacterium]
MNDSINLLDEQLDKSGIYLNPKEVLFKNVLLNLRVSEVLKPTWLLDDEYGPVFFPVVYKNIVDGEILAFFSDGKDRFPAIVKSGNKIIFNFNADETIRFLLNEQYLKAGRLFYKLLPFHYHLVPGSLRRQIKKISVALQKKTSTAAKLKFPSWPRECSVEIIRHILFACQGLLGARQKDKFPSWPKDKKFAVALSHDIDTPAGFRNIDKFINIERKYNLRSCWFVVGEFFKSYKSQLSALVQDGFEIGCHGYVHDNKLTSLSPEKMRESLLKCTPMINALGIKGFRSPSLLRSEQLFRLLKDLFLYDTSVPDTEAFLAIAPRSGCCSVFPYKISEGLLEVPITLPLDSTFLALDYKPEEILKAWQEKIAWIKKLGGMAHLAIHAETYYSGSDNMLKVYERLLDFICNNEDSWITKPQDIALWWQEKNNV